MHPVWRQSVLFAERRRQYPKIRDSSLNRCLIQGGRIVGNSVVERVKVLFWCQAASFRNCETWSYILSINTLLCYFGTIKCLFIMCCSTKYNLLCIHHEILSSEIRVQWDQQSLEHRERSHKYRHFQSCSFAQSDLSQLFSTFDKLWSCL